MFVFINMAELKFFLWVDKESVGSNLFSADIDLAKPKSRARTSQGHNAFPWPGLEPRSSDSEPSALTTGLLDKAMALACPQYSWPHMFKVAPCTVVWSYNQIFSAWWVTTILHNYGATLCKFRHDKFSLFLGNWEGRYPNWALCGIFINITISSISFSVQWSTAREDTPGRSINSTVCELCWPRNLACCCHLGLSNPWFDAV